MQLPTKSSITLTKVFLGLTIIFSSFVSYIVIHLYKNPHSDAALRDKTTNDKPSVFKEAAKPIYLPPIEIAFLSTKLSIEPIGIEVDGMLSVPSGWDNAGWYEYGSKPGEEGNVIIDAHYDDNMGAPAAFWNLKNLSTGDKVTLADKIGRVYTYVVEDIYFVDINDPQRTDIFNETKDKKLILITCGGVWDARVGMYNKRLVVSAIYEKMEKTW